MTGRDVLEPGLFADAVQDYESSFGRKAVPGTDESEGYGDIYEHYVDAGLDHAQLLEAAQLAAKRLGGTLGILVDVVDAVPVDAHVTTLAQQSEE